jgi:Transposase DDE domain
MARRHLASVARRGQAQQPIQPPLNRRLRRFLAAELCRLRPIIAKSAKDSKADRYRKHFRAFSHACLLIFHGLSRAESLHQSYSAFASCEGLVALSGLALPTKPSASEPSREPSDQGLAVSYSQFAASNSTRPAAFLAGLIPTLVLRVRQSGQLAAAGFPPELHLFDSTFLRLSLVLSPWLPNRGPSDIPGVKLHLQYAPTLDLPEHVLVSDSHTSDREGFDQAILDDPLRLEGLRGQTIAIDLGYYGHVRFERLLAAEVHFVSRRLAQASYQVERDLPIQQPLPGLSADLYPERIRVVSDQRISLGSALNSRGAVLQGLRLVTAEVCPLAKAARRGAKIVRYEILTDRWDLGAADVVQLYLWRWQIELFLRWLKSHVHLPRLLGYSPNAVALTVWLAVVVHLLTVLAALALGLARRSPTLLNQLPWALARLTAQDQEGLIDAYLLPLPLLDSPLTEPAPT